MVVTVAQNRQEKAFIADLKQDSLNISPAKEIFYSVNILVS